jgi:hypothetical protein
MLLGNRSPNGTIQGAINDLRNEIMKMLYDHRRRIIAICAPLYQ